MANKDKHSQKRDYMHDGYSGSKAESVAKAAKKRYHKARKQKRKLKWKR